MSGGLNSKLPAAKAPENTRCKFSKAKCSCKSAGIFTGAIAWRGLIHWQICFTSSTWYLPSHCPGIDDVRCDLPVFPIYGDVSYKQHSLQVFEGYLPGVWPRICEVQCDLPGLPRVRNMVTWSIVWWSFAYSNYWEAKFFPMILPPHQGQPSGKYLAASKKWRHFAL